MHRWVWMIVLMAGAGGALQVLAAPAANRQPSPRRLLLACMTKHMAASRTISYNEASALCKAQLKTLDPAVASSAEPRPVNGLGR